MRSVPGFSPLFNFDDKNEQEIKEIQAEILAAEERGRKKGFEEGEKKGTGERLELDAKILALLSSMEAKFSNLFDNITKLRDAAAEDAAKIALSAAKKTTGDAFASSAKQGIEDAVRKCIDLAIKDPEINICVNSSLAEEMTKKIESIAAEKNFSGKVVVRQSDSLKPGDCTLEWKDGGAVLDNESKWKKIEEIVLGISVQ